MPKPYSQDLRDRVIDAVKRGKMSRRAAARSVRDQADPWRSNGLSVLNGKARESLSGTAVIRGFKLMPYRAFLEAARVEKSDVTLSRPCAIGSFPAERGVEADTSMMSRFFRRIGVTVKKRPLSHASRIART